jgi:hypothetical protein
VKDALIFKYQPFQYYIIFLLFMLVCGLFVALLGYFSLLDGAYQEIPLLMAITSLCFVLSKYLIDYLQLNVLLNTDGLTTMASPKYKSRFVPWEEIKYGYIATSYNGHRFLLLSGEALNKEDTKRLANKAIFLKGMWLGNVLVIYLNETRNATSLLDLIQDKSSITYIDGR